MKKRNMLTKVAALSMAALMTVTGLPVAGLDGALSAEAAKLSTAYELQVGGAGSATILVGDTTPVGIVSGGNLVTGAIAISGASAKSDAVVFVDNDDVVVSNSGVNVNVKTANTVALKGIKPATYEVNGEAQVDRDKISDSYAKATVKVAQRDINSTAGSENVTIGVSLTKSGDTTKLDTQEFTSNSGTLSAQSYTENGYTITLDSMTVGTTALDVRSQYMLSATKADGTTTTGATAINLTDAKAYSISVKPQNATSTSPVIGAWAFDFEISASDFSANTVSYTGSAVKYSVNGNETQNIVTGQVAVKDTNGNTVPQNNFTIATSDDSGSGVPQVGTAGGKITVTPKNGCGYDTSSTATGTFEVAGKTINGASNSFTTTKKYSANTSNAGTNVIIPEIASGTSLANEAATGAAIQPAITVYDAEMVGSNSPLYTNAYLAGKTDDGDECRYVALTAGTDYDVTYGTNTATGTGYVYVNFKGNYAGSLTLTFDIVAADKSIANTATVTMKYNSKEIANGGSITYREADKYMAPTITIKNVDSSNTKNNFSTTVTPTNGVYPSNTYVSVKIADNDEVGTAKVTIKGVGSFAGTIEQTFEITQKDIDTVTDSTGITKSSNTYTGSAIAPEIAKGKITDTKTTDALVEDEDFKVYYDNNTNAGTATITLAGIGNYTGTKTITYTISPAKVTDSKFAIADIANQVLKDGAATPTVEATFTLADGSKQALVQDEDYTLTYANNTSTTTSAKVTLTGAGNFTGTKTVTFIIVSEEADLANAVITLTTPSYEYDGDYHAAAIKTVKLGDSVLTSGTDYALVSSVSEMAAGEYAVQIKGGTNKKYGGTGTATFTIAPKALTAATVTLDGTTTFTYNGKAKTVKVASVTLDGTTVASEDDYTISGTSATAAGSKTVKATFKGNYSGTATAKWTINKAANTLKVSPTSKSFKVKAVKKAKKTFTIKATKAQGKVTYKSSSKKVTVSSKGKVTVKKGTKKGTYKITVKAAGNTNYNAASKTVTIKVK